MRKILLIICSILFASPAFAAISFVDGKWSTTFNCNEWVQGQSLNCDDLSLGGGWTCSGQGDQIVTAASYSGGDGGRGFRHWQGDGNNVNGGGIGVVFPSAQPEIWVRWYMRYEDGFKWSHLTYDKWLYMWTSQSENYIVLGLDGWNRQYVVSRGSHLRSTGSGWQDIYGTASDGSWYAMEAHLKMNSAIGVSDGIARLWLNGDLIFEDTAVNFSGSVTSSLAGLATILIGSNQSSPSNGRPMAVDYDDIVIYNTMPSNIDAQGNPFIGPIGWGDSKTTNPPSEPVPNPMPPQDLRIISW